MQIIEVTQNIKKMIIGNNRVDILPNMPSKARKFKYPQTIRTFMK